MQSMAHLKCQATAIHTASYVRTALDLTQTTTTAGLTAGAELRCLRPRRRSRRLSRGIRRRMAGAVAAATAVAARPRSCVCLSRGRAGECGWCGQRRRGRRHCSGRLLQQLKLSVTRRRAAPSHLCLHMHGTPLPHLAGGPCALFPARSAAHRRPCAAALHAPHGAAGPRRCKHGQLSAAGGTTHARRWDRPWPAARWGGCARRAGAGAQGSRSVKWKVEPRSAADSTQIVPPISSARRREIARPRPGRAPECSTSRALAALVMNYSACMALHQRRNTQQRCRRAGHSWREGPRCRAVPWAHAKAGLAAAHPCRRTCGSWTRGPAGSTGTASSWSRPRCRCPCRGS